MIVLSFAFSAIGPFSDFSLVGSSLWSSVKWPSLDFLVIVFSLSFSVIGFFFSLLRDSFFFMVDSKEKAINGHNH